MKAKADLDENGRAGQEGAASRHRVFVRNGQLVLRKSKETTKELVSDRRSAQKKSHITCKCNLNVDFENAAI